MCSAKKRLKKLMGQKIKNKNIKLLKLKTLDFERKYAYGYQFNCKRGRKDKK